MGSLFGRKNEEEATKEETRRPVFEQLSYGAAYSLLPSYLFADETGGTRSLLIEAPRVAGIKLLVGASMFAEIEPDEPMMNRFSETKGHSGRLIEGVHYRIVEYPRPAPLNVEVLEQIENLAPEQLMKLLASVVLAPYFSILLLNEDLELLEYLVLGQSLDGGTTLRNVDNDVNANLGPGCEPELDVLLSFLAQRGEAK